MGTQGEHLRKSQDNEAFATGLDNTKSVHAGWAVTALFYSAVHQVQAHFVARGKYPTSHSVRGSAIQRDSKLKEIYGDYREMETCSRTTRYDIVPTTASDVQRIAACLSRIKAVVSARKNNST